MLNITGINPNTPTNDGYTPLILAAIDSNEDLTTHILKLSTHEEIEENINSIIDLNLKDAGNFLLNIIEPAPNTSFFTRTSPLEKSVRRLQDNVQDNAQGSGCAPSCSIS